GLPAEGIKEVKPFPVRVQGGAVEDLKHTLYFPFCDQWNAKIDREFFTRQQIVAGEIVFLFQVLHMDDLFIEDDPSSQTFAGAQAGGGDCLDSEAPAFVELEASG